MELRIEPGKYVVAVSGGVDSIVLLDLLRQQPEVELVVAHFDHGIRADSGEDRKLVEEISKKYGLLFFYEEGKLDANASEAAAREARYAFLNKVQKEQGAHAIVTAHHQDDVLETAILNMLRGTGRKGLSSLKNRENIVRPLLRWTKKEIYTYATDHGLKWREDITNTDELYLRNYIRHKIVPRFSKQDKKTLLGRINAAGQINEKIDNLLAGNLSDQLERQWFIMLPYAVSCEVMATWLRQNGVVDFNRPLIERLVTTAKTKPAGKFADINAGLVLQIGKENLKIAKRPSIMARYG